MTWTPNGTFGTALSSRQKAVRFAVEFAGYSTVFTTGAVSSASWTYKRLLSMADIDNGEIDPRSGRTTLSQIKFHLVDDGNEIRNLISSERKTPALANMGGRIVTLWMGFAGLAQANWEVVGRFAVEEVELVEPGRYRFTARDPFQQFALPLFGSLLDTARTQIKVAAAIGVSTIEVQDNAKFTTGDSVLLFDGLLEQWTTISGLSGPEITQKFIYLTDPTILALSTNATIVKARRIRGNPINIAMRLVLDDFATVGAIQTDYPITTVSGTFVAGDGFGVPSTLIDKTAIQAERDTFMSDLVGEIRLVSRVDDGWTYLQSFMRGLALMVVRRSGLLSLRGYHLPLSTSGTPAAINDDEMMAATWRRPHSESINRVVVSGDMLGSEMTTLATVEDVDSVAVIGKREVVVESPWLRTSLGGADTAAVIGGRIIGRFSAGHQVIEASAFMSKMTLEPGDYVGVTHPSLPDTSQNLAMTGQGAEVIASGLDLGSGTVSLEMWLYSGRRAGGITLEAQADFGSASATEKLQNAFITAEDGFMPDNTPGYVWV